MLFPIRCFTCGKVVAQYQLRYEKVMEEGEKTQEEILDDLGMKRSCCRTCFITHTNLIDRKLKMDVMEPDPSKC